MALSTDLPLAAWENFYVIVGSSAGALTGLTFIVITIAADANMGNSPTTRLVGLRAFVTPTAVHFGAALWIAALVSIPGQTGVSLAICLAASGLIGTLYCATIAHWMLEVLANYKPFLADWIWSLVLPLCAYLGLLVAAMLLHAHVLLALYLVAGVSLLLLLLGLHNAWDVVIWITAERHARSYRQRADHARADDKGSTE